MIIMWLHYALSLVCLSVCSSVCSMLLISQEQQEAQLSQRDRAMLRVVDCFAKSLKVIRNDSIGISLKLCL